MKKIIKELFVYIPEVVPLYAYILGFVLGRINNYNLVLISIFLYIFVNLFYHAYKEFLKAK